MRSTVCTPPSTRSLPGCARLGHRRRDCGDRRRTRLLRRPRIRRATGSGAASTRNRRSPTTPRASRAKNDSIPGVCFTVEPMINVGKRYTALDKQDGWTVRTRDGELSAQFEHTLLMTEDGPEILTQTQQGPQKGPPVLRYAIERIVRSRQPQSAQCPDTASACACHHSSRRCSGACQHSALPPTPCSDSSTRPRPKVSLIHGPNVARLPCAV